MSLTNWQLSEWGKGRGTWIGDIWTDSCQVAGTILVLLGTRLLLPPTPPSSFLLSLSSQMLPAFCSLLYQRLAFPCFLAPVFLTADSHYWMFLCLPPPPIHGHRLVGLWDSSLTPVKVSRQVLAAAGIMHPPDEACPMCQHLGFAFSASPGSFILPQLFCLVQFTHYPGVLRVSFLNIRLWHDHFQNVLIISDRIQNLSSLFRVVCHLAS